MLNRWQWLQGCIAESRVFRDPLLPSLSSIRSEFSPVLKVPQPLSQKLGKAYIFSGSEISGAWDGSGDVLGKESLSGN